MRTDHLVAIIIPALNEEAAISRVISAIPPWADEVIVVDNGSTDRTAEVAAAHGARVLKEPRPGYGAACLTGIKALNKPEIVVFLDGDFSDSPEEMSFLVDPIIRGEADLVIGSRVRGRRQPGALSPQARFGNWLSCLLIRLIWGFRFTDLGPFRAIRYPALLTLDMQDRDYGWTVEMQVKAISHKLRVLEVPVAYNRRIGKSKISGTLRGVLGAGAKILFTIFKQAITRRNRRHP